MKHLTHLVTWLPGHPSRLETHLVLGSFQEALGVTFTLAEVDIASLNQDYQLEAFNQLEAPGSSPDSTSSSNCFQLVSVHLEQPGAPLQVLQALFGLHPAMDYLVVLLPRAVGLR